MGVFWPQAFHAQIFGWQRKAGADAAGEQAHQQQRIKKQHRLDGFENTVFIQHYAHGVERQSLRDRMARVAKLLADLTFAFPLLPLKAVSQAHSKLELKAITSGPGTESRHRRP